MDTAVTYTIRVWLPDRPGALGAVATRLGGLKGDLQGLEIIERSGGIAVDDLVVALPAEVPTSLVCREISQVDGVEVEEIRPLEGVAYDPQLDALETAAILLGSETVDDLAEALCDHICRCIRLSWAAVVDHQDHLLAAHGPTPNVTWLTAFVAGSPSVGEAGTDNLDLEALWVPLPATSASLIVGRDVAFRWRERHRLAAMARIADSWSKRLGQLSRMRCMAAHPSYG